MIDDDPEDLVLAGYVALVDNGLALPCYGASSRPNAWYVARSAIEGDRLALIVGFEQFECEDVLALPEQQHVTVRIGSPWLDVFVLDRSCYVGTAAQIYQSLGRARDRACEAAPLSFVDLLLGDPARDPRPYVEAAIGTLGQRFGERWAQDWLYDLLGRQTALLALRRVARDAGLAPEASEALADIELDPFGHGRVIVEVPHAGFVHFADAKLEDEAARCLEIALARIGVGLVGVAWAKTSRIKAAKRPAHRGLRQDTLEILDHWQQGRVVYPLERRPDPRVLDHLGDCGVTHFDIASGGDAKTVRQVLPDALISCIRGPFDNSEMQRAYSVHNVRCFGIANGYELIGLAAATDNATDLELVFTADDKLDDIPPGAVQSVHLTQDTEEMRHSSASQLLFDSRQLANVLSLLIDLSGQGFSTGAIQAGFAEARALIVKAAVTVDKIIVIAELPDTLTRTSAFALSETLDRLVEAFESMPISYSAELWVMPALFESN